METVIKLFFSVILISLSIKNVQSELGYHEPCDPANSEDPANRCDLYNGLTCQENICECVDLTVMEYDNSSRRCRVFSGENCVFNVTLNTEVQLNCVENAFCNGAGDICTCEYEYSISDDRRCLPSYYARCNKTEDCNPHDLLECKLGYCLCPNPLNDKFDRKEFKCHSTLGSACDPEDSNAKVTCKAATAECKTDSLSTNGFSCQCKNNLLPSPDHEECKKGHLQECVESYNEEEDCLSEAGLRCYAGQCQCRYEPDQVWDETLKSCASVEGSKCTIWDDSEQYVCQSGLECVPYAGPFFGICRKKSSNSDDPSTSTTISVTGSTLSSTATIHSSTEKNNGTGGGANSIITNCNFQSISIVSLILFTVITGFM